MSAPYHQPTTLSRMRRMTGSPEEPSQNRTASRFLVSKVCFREFNETLLRRGECTRSAVSPALLKKPLDYGCKGSGSRS